MAGNSARESSAQQWREAARWSHQSGQARVQEYALQAFVQLVVFFLGVGVLVAFYYNFCVLDHYLSALFWAVMCSIPMFQIKIAVINLMLQLLDWWWSVKYRILDVSDDGFVQLRGLASAFCATPEIVSSADAAAASTASEDDTRRTLPLGAAMEVAEVRRRLSLDEELHAVVQHRRVHGKSEIVRVIRKPHWLGTCRPYDSFYDLLRDVPILARAIACFLAIVVEPLGHFNDKTGSKPYFGLLIRLCALQFCYKFFGKEAVVFVSFYGAHLYFVLVLFRVVFMIMGYLAPNVRSFMTRLFPTCYGCAERLASFVFHYSVKLGKFSFGVAKSFFNFGLAFGVDNCHWMLSTFIVLSSILLGVNAFHFFCVCLREEAFFIWQTLHNLLHSIPLYEDAVAEVTRFVQQSGEAAGSTGENQTVAGLLHLGQSYIASTLPAYEEWMQANVPNFAIIKYLFHDIWWDEDPLKVVRPKAAYAKVAKNAAENEACALAAAMGASCVPSSADDAKEPLQLHKTTSLLRLLVNRNFSNALFLGREAYAELASASSLLGGGDEGLEGETASGMLNGATWIARLTASGAVSIVKVLQLASSMLGQAIVFFTALFYLLAAKASCLDNIGELLRVIDQSKVIFRISDNVVRAVLLSALKMAAFHALFTWLLYSWGEVPVVVVPSVLSALVALVPAVSPVWSVSVWAAVYQWVQNNKISSVVTLLLNFAVWWQVPTVIYAEIPESNAWLTGLSVVLGISHFGVTGVVLGPLIASVPLICLNLLRLFNSARQEGTDTPKSQSGHRNLFNFYQTETWRSYNSELVDDQGHRETLPVDSKAVRRHRVSSVGASLGDEAEMQEMQTSTSCLLEQQRHEEICERIFSPKRNSTLIRMLPKSDPRTWKYSRRSAHLVRTRSFRRKNSSASIVDEDESPRAQEVQETSKKKVVASRKSEARKRQKDLALSEDAPQSTVEESDIQETMPLTREGQQHEGLRLRRRSSGSTGKDGHRLTATQEGQPDDEPISSHCIDL